MSWARIDDGFTGNPKIVELTDGEFRVWMRVICFCARAKDPTVDEKVRREVAGLTRGRINRFWTLGLLDQVKDAYEVHDWPKYQPKDATGAERQAKWRSRNQTVTEPLQRPLREPLRPSRARRSSRPVPEPVPEEKTASKDRTLGLTEARPLENGQGFEAPELRGIA